MYVLCYKHTVSYRWVYNILGFVIWWYTVAVIVLLSSIVGLIYMSVYFRRCVRLWTYVGFLKCAQHGYGWCTIVNGFNWCCCCSAAVSRWIVFIAVHIGWAERWIYTYVYCAVIWCVQKLWSMTLVDTDLCNRTCYSCAPLLSIGVSHARVLLHSLVCFEREPKKMKWVYTVCVCVYGQTEIIVLTWNKNICDADRQTDRRIVERTNTRHTHTHTYA